MMIALYLSRLKGNGLNLIGLNMMASIYGKIEA